MEEVIINLTNIIKYDECIKIYYFNSNSVNTIQSVPYKNNK
jgi:hypothetical protein